MFNQAQYTAAHIANLYDSERFTVTSHCDDAHTKVLAVLIVDQRTEPPRMTSLSGPTLEALTWRIRQWELKVPEQAEVELTLEGYVLGAQPLNTH